MRETGRFAWRSMLLPGLCPQRTACNREPVGGKAVARAALDDTLMVALQDGKRRAWSSSGSKTNTTNFSQAHGAYEVHGMRTHACANKQQAHGIRCKEAKAGRCAYVIIHAAAVWCGVQDSRHR